MSKVMKFARIQFISEDFVKHSYLNYFYFFVIRKNKKLYHSEKYPNTWSSVWIHLNWFFLSFFFTIGSYRGWNLLGPEMSRDDYSTNELKPIGWIEFFKIIELNSIIRIISSRVSIINIKKNKTNMIIVCSIIIALSNEKIERSVWHLQYSGSGPFSGF